VGGAVGVGDTCVAAVRRGTSNGEWNASICVGVGVGVGVGVSVGDKVGVGVQLGRA
jgi:hypothetical protein